MTDSPEPATEPTGRGVTVEWRLFADLAEAAVRATTVDLPADATARTALDALLDANQGLDELVLGDDGLAEHVTLLRNGSRVDELTEPVADGDELALMPPVSGG